MRKIVKYAELFSRIFLFMFILALAYISFSKLFTPAENAAVFIGACCIWGYAMSCTMLWWNEEKYQKYTKLFEFCKVFTKAVVLFFIGFYVKLCIFNTIPTVTVVIICVGIGLIITHFIADAINNEFYE